MTLGKPNMSIIDYYICVSSKQAIKLHSCGFQPMYREIKEDKIYYLKTKELMSFIKKGGLN